MTDAATTREANPPQPADDRTDSAAMSRPISGQEAVIQMAGSAVRAAYFIGRHDFANGKTPNDNPFGGGTYTRASWDDGYKAAASESDAANRAADNAWLDAPAATRRDLIYRAYLAIDMVAAVGIDGIAEKRDRDRIIKAREDLHTALYGGR